MPRSDLPRLSDLPEALRLLTRLPLPASEAAPRPASAWAWPLAGLLVTALALLAGRLALPAGAGIAAVVVLGVQAMLTGAMHEDGLADTADGFWGGWDRARRLEIMKDSHIGSYGVMALLVIGLLRWSALTALLAAGEWAAVLAVGALSRAPMALLMAFLPAARTGGLSRAVGRPMASTAGGSLALAALIALPFCGVMPGALALLAALLVTLALGALARAKISGQTGDVLGASQQLTEAACLAVLAALLLP
ncbi:adenosylcobinamide-GDP ribazoletransferase [Szabonella alba]|uniref:Adenosylcobinamide-GDP ribazoletransferase n=1 Tax=Szabonella alba TaxID=2804194 RepID=A0A8K0V9U3_9RHOB|nr:adenosylcobinamide-GDP ribazoletransferase [Szabonella alba]MBL4916303.1 adenosylcobinamide-GDP ribazoletransferase [Szabonella alba]